MEEESKYTEKSVRNASLSELADMLGEYNEWRRGEGKYRWSEDPEKNLPMPIAPRPFGLLIDRVVDLIAKGDCKTTEVVFGVEAHSVEQSSDGRFGKCNVGDFATLNEARQYICKCLSEDSKFSFGKWKYVIYRRSVEIVEEHSHEKAENVAKDERP